MDMPKIDNEAVMGGNTPVATAPVIETAAVTTDKPKGRPAQTAKKTTTTKSTTTYVVQSSFCGFKKGEEIERNGSNVNVQRCISKGLIKVK